MYYVTDTFAERRFVYVFKFIYLCFFYTHRNFFFLNQSIKYYFGLEKPAVGVSVALLHQ